MRHYFSLFLIICSMSISMLSNASAETQPGSLKRLEEISNKVKKFTLDNGLKVLYFERALVPVFVGEVWVKVGSSDELSGKTGAAHLLEHMAFKGTTTIGTKDYAKEEPLLKEYNKIFEDYRVTKNAGLKVKLEELESKLSELWVNGEFTSLYQNHGATGLNAGTSTDYTMYTAALPSTELEFWFSMESERLKNPVFRQFYKELEVVKEERRMRFDDVPSGKLLESILATSYWGHPYHNLVIGWKSDLDRLGVDDAKYLHQTYYRPDNMVIVLTGDLRGQDILALSNKYFGSIKNPDTALTRNEVSPAVQNGERIVRVKYDSEPMMFLGFHVPSTPHPDALALSLLHAVLADGEASILERELKHKKKLITSIFTTELPGERYDPLFIIGVTPAPGKTYDEVEQAIYQELQNLKKSGIPDQKFQAIKRKTKFSYLAALSSNQGISDIIASKELLHGDWKIVLKEYDMIQNATKEEVIALIDRYFAKNKQTRVEIIPGK
jgi:predicted Zn-dependent peptidase